MSKKKSTGKGEKNRERPNNGKAWAKNHGKSGGPKPKSPEKAARRKAVLDRQRTPVAERKSNG